MKVLKQVIQNRIQKENHGECDCENQHTFSFFEFILEEFREGFCKNTKHAKTDHGAQRIHQDIVNVGQTVAEKLRNFNKGCKARSRNEGIFK